MILDAVLGDLKVLVVFVIYYKKQYFNKIIWLNYFSLFPLWGNLLKSGRLKRLRFK